MRHSVLHLFIVPVHHTAYQRWFVIPWFQINDKKKSKIEQTHSFICNRFVVSVAFPNYLLSCLSCIVFPFACVSCFCSRFQYSCKGRCTFPFRRSPNDKLLTFSLKPVSFNFIQHCFLSTALFVSSYLATRRQMLLQGHVSRQCGRVENESRREGTYA